MLLALLLLAAPPAVGPVPADLRRDWNLHPVYAKHASVDGFPVLASVKVSDAGVREAARIARHMLAGRPDARDAMIRNRIRLVVMHVTEQTTDVPEHSDLTPKAYWDARARGLGATKHRPAVSCGEENLLHLPGDRYPAENILVHEFAHAIAQMGVEEVEPDFAAKLAACFDRAKAAGRWAGTYARTNKEEYWAEAVQSYYDCNDPTDRHQHNGVWNRRKLAEHDPEVHALIEATLRRPGWRYVWPE